MENTSEITTEKIKRRNIISPWRNVTEFRDVCEYIYGESSNLSTWERAIQELRVWINRRRAQCPAAVYATQTILEVKLVDGRNKVEKDALRSLYAFALVRFFNFMSSTKQSHNMRSMYSTAIELGLDSFVVDIRHICAHGTELPELSILRRTAEYCLNWLHGYYWRVQSEKMSDADANCLKKRDKSLRKCAKDLVHLFQLYDIVLECHLNRYETMKEIKQKIRGRKLTILKEYLKSKNLKTIRKVFDVIVQDMFAIIKSGVGRKHLPAIFAREFMKMKYFFTVAKTHNIGIELEELIDVIQNLFRFFAINNIIGTILHRLFETAESPSDIPEAERLGACFWARHILEGLEIFISCKKKHNDLEENTKKSDHTTMNFGTLPKNVRQTYLYSGVNMKRSIIFGDSFQRPWVWHFTRSYLENRIKAINRFTAPILPSVWALVRPKIDEDEISQLKQLIEIFLTKNEADNVEGNGIEKINDISEDKIYTLNDVFSEKPLKNNIETSENGGWFIVNDGDYDWSNCPIGSLPWN